MSRKRNPTTTAPAAPKSKRAKTKVVWPPEMLERFRRADEECLRTGKPAQVFPELGPPTWELPGGEDEYDPV